MTCLFTRPSFLGLFLIHINGGMVLGYKNSTLSLENKAGYSHVHVAKQQLFFCLSFLSGVHRHLFYTWAALTNKPCFIIKGGPCMKQVVLE